MTIQRQIVADGVLPAFVIKLVVAVFLGNERVDLRQSQLLLLT